MKTSQHSFGVFCKGSLIWCEDENIIHINDDDAFINHVEKDVIHHGLKSGWGVTHPKKHYGGFEKPPVCFKRCLPLIAISNSYIVIPPSNVEFGESAPFSLSSNSVIRGSG